MCWEEWYLLVRLNAGAAEQNMFDHQMTKSRCKCGKGKRCWRRWRWRDREEKRKKEDYWKQKTSFKPCWIWYNWCSCFYFLMSTQAWSRAALLTRASRGLAWCQHKLLAWRTMKRREQETATQCSREPWHIFFLLHCWYGLHFNSLWKYTSSVWMPGTVRQSLG